ncbi:hypothetical protein, partial [Pygmaiobacter massiliensis]|uniref:hypothetical protein n=1 Tax=Pygmaiobacter massiliensis TaxID=1917873 RepID=UPI0028A1410C
SSSQSLQTNLRIKLDTTWRLNLLLINKRQEHIKRTILSAAHMLNKRLLPYDEFKSSGQFIGYPCFSRQ